MTEKIPLDDLIRIAEREAQMRRNVYPGRVRAGKMTEAQADAETAGMDQIAVILRWFKRWEQPIRDAVNKRQADVAEIERLKEEDPGVAALVDAFPDAQLSLLEPST